MREEVPDYARLQEEAAGATGAGATLVGLDASRETLDHARGALPVERVALRVARLEEPLPDGPFDVIVSVLAVHHLDGTGKADLFRRGARALSSGGRLVVGDVVIQWTPPP